MKLATTASVLTKGLKSLLPVIERRNTIPILGCVQIDGRLLRGTDLDVELAIKLPATEAEGSICIDHRSLFALVRNIPGDETITIEGDGSSATVTFSSGRYDLATAPASDFPDINIDDNRHDVPIDGERLKAAISFVSPSISTEETRYYLNGVCLDSERAVATDGHRMSIHPLGFDGTLFNKCIVPRKTVSILNGLPAPKSVQIANDKKIGMMISFDGATVITKLIDGTFPDYTRVIPTSEPAAVVSLNRDEARRAISRMLAISDDSWNGLSLAWDGGRVAIVRHNSVKTAREYLPLSTATGAAGLISFNGNYVRTALASFQSEAVSLATIDESSPAIWRGDKDGPFIVLMPMRGDDRALANETLQQWATATPIGRAA